MLVAVVLMLHDIGLCPGSGSFQVLIQQPWGLLHLHGGANTDEIGE